MDDRPDFVLQLCSLRLIAFRSIHYNLAPEVPVFWVFMWAFDKFSKLGGWYYIIEFIICGVLIFYSI